jgi:hypothetical protein
MKEYYLTLSCWQTSWLLCQALCACYMLGLLERRNFWTSHRGGTIHRGSKNTFFSPTNFIFFKQYLVGGPKYVCMYVCVGSIMEWAFIYPPHQGKGREVKWRMSHPVSLPFFLCCLDDDQIILNTVN